MPSCDVIYEQLKLELSLNGLGCAEFGDIEADAVVAALTDAIAGADNSNAFSEPSCESSDGIDRRKRRIDAQGMGPDPVSSSFVQPVTHSSRQTPSMFDMSSRRERRALLDADGLTASPSPSPENSSTLASVTVSTVVNVTIDAYDDAALDDGGGASGIAASAAAALAAMTSSGALASAIISYAQVRRDEIRLTFTTCSRLSHGVPSCIFLAFTLPLPPVACAIATRIKPAE